MKFSMNKIKTAFQNKAFRKRFIIISASIIFVILLAVVMYLVGKSHTVNIANMNVTTEDGTVYKALDEADVRFKKTSFTSYSGFSDEVLSVGQHNTLTVVYKGNTYSKRFHIPNKWGAVIISLPLFISEPDNVSKWLSEVQYTVPQLEEDSPASETGDAEFSM